MLRRHFSNPIIFAVASLLSACTAGNLSIATSETVNLVITTGDESEKTILNEDGTVSWGLEGERLCVMETRGGSTKAYTSAEGTSADGGKTMSFTAALTPDYGTGFIYDAVYPASAVQNPGTSTPASTALTLPDVQTALPHSFDPAADLLIAKAVESESQATSLKMCFHRPVALGRIFIRNLGSTEQIQKIRFSATHSGAAVPVAGEMTFNLRTARSDGSAAKASTLLEINCEDVDFNPTTGGIGDLEVTEFDWETGLVKDGDDGDDTPVSLLTAKGATFSCWPFSLTAGDSFEVSVITSDEIFTKKVTLSSGRSLELSAGNLSCFTVNFAGLSPEPWSPEPEATGRQAAWLGGSSLEIAGESLNASNSGLEDIFISKSTTINDSSLEGKIVFIDADATLTLGAPAILSNTVFVSNDPDARASVKLSANSSIKLDGDASGSHIIAFKDIDCDFSAATGNAVFTMAANSTGIGSMLFDGCNISGLAKGFFSTTSSQVGFIRNFALNGCDWEVSADALYLINAGWANTSKIETLRVTGCDIHSTSGSAAHKMKWLTNGENVALRSVQVDDNIFLNILGSGDNGGLIRCISTENLSVKENLVHYSAGSALPNNFFVIRTDADVTGTLSGCGAYDNFIYPETSGLGFCAYWFVNSGISLDKQASWQNSLGWNPFSSVDVAKGTFTYQCPVFSASVTADGKQTECTVDRSAKKIYVRHSPYGTDPAIRPMPRVSLSAPAGSWPTKSVSTTCGTDADIVQIVLSDWVDASSVLQLAVSNDGWNMVWNDEFVYPAIDANCWQICGIGESGWNHAMDPDDPSLITLDGQSVTLWAKKAASTDKGYNGYVTGGIRTAGLKTFDMDRSVCGRVDVRARMTNAKGFWPAIWMIPYPPQFNPRGGEFDLMEHPSYVANGSSPNSISNKMYLTLHTPYTRWGESADTTKTGNGVSTSCTLTDYETNYHVFTALVIYDEVRLLVDGNCYLQYNKKNILNSYKGKWDDGYYWPFDTALYQLILSAQLGGVWAGEPTGSGLPAKLEIDYVRYFNKTK